ncbi:uncharacterized protein N0V89_002856 [Didymosphaeria variabile]|uniref:Uncharacterized protein n=1 Tax=Didymosphaeria variabile TaxID=1932322 RepID=A0A9W8XSW0_9PLEO|nr:uncharacterized protein N0V89_002856 [Didymosphaeria variabile]KAJ4358276.1 hypothetical protein N0V89_002856 [Didymosphaeria variabile]
MSDGDRLVLTEHDYEAEANEFWYPTPRQQMNRAVPTQEQLENKVWRKCMDIGSTQKALSEAPTDAAPMLDPEEKSRVFRIIDLPAELRLNIYAQALTVGKVFYTPTAFEIRKGRRFDRCKEYEKPNVVFRAIGFLRAAEGYIELNYSNSFCPFGCCRLMHMSCDVIRRHMPKCVRALDTTFAGAQALNDNGMTYLIREWVSSTGMTVEKMKKKFGFMVDGKDVWEAYILAHKYKHKVGAEA